MDYIVIKKEDLFSPLVNPLLRSAVNRLIEEGKATELSTDKSIIDRAERYGHSFNKNDNMREFFAYKDGATEQSIIEQMKEKEFAEWCSINEWYYSTASKGWHNPLHIHDFFTTEELFNQFTNQK